MDAVSSVRVPRVQLSVPAELVLSCTRPALLICSYVGSMFVFLCCTHLLLPIPILVVILKKELAQMKRDEVVYLDKL